jgi:hypothetical protein
MMGKIEVGSTKGCDLPTSSGHCSTQIRLANQTNSVESSRAFRLHRIKLFCRVEAQKPSEFQLNSMKLLKKGVTRLPSSWKSENHRTEN